MAELMAVRTAIKTTLETYIPELHVYRHLTENAIVLPCVIVQPTSADFIVAMGRGTDELRFDLIVLVSYNELETAQHNLDPYVSSSGSKSIRQVIFEHRDLGVPGWNATVTNMTDYGARFKGEYQGRGHEQLSAILGMTVYTRGDS